MVESDATVLLYDYKSVSVKVKRRVRVRIRFSRGAFFWQLLVRPTRTEMRCMMQEMTLLDVDGPRLAPASQSFPAPRAFLDGALTAQCCNAPRHIVPACIWGDMCWFWIYRAVSDCSAMLTVTVRCHAFPIWLDLMALRRDGLVA